MHDIVGLLLDDAMPPERLGELLHAARKRRGMKRKQAAAVAGTTPAQLRAYERGDEPVPASVCAQLAECYGDDLTAHVPLRVPPSVGDGRLTVGAQTRAIDAEADVIAAYVDILQRLRRVQPGEPVALRSADLVALAGALGHDREVIEARIAETLGCTAAEAHRLHGDLLRRKVILPVAGLAAGVAAFAGTAYAAQSPAPAPTPPARPAVAAAPAPTTTSTIAPPTTTPTTVAPAATTTPTASAPAPGPAALPAPTGAAHAEHAPPATVAPDQTDATVPASEQAADVPTVAADPRPDPEDPPMSVLPGETPITIIGAPDSTVAPPAG